VIDETVFLLQKPQNQVFPEPHGAARSGWFKRGGAVVAPPPNWFRFFFCNKPPFPVQTACSCCAHLR